MGLRKASFFRDGSQSLAKSARPGVIALTLAKHAPIFAILCLPPALWSLAEAGWAFALVLIVPAVLSLVLYLIVLRRPLPEDLRGVEALVSLCLVLLTSALILTPAFITLGMPPLDGFFEAMSAVTTTGLSVARDAESWPFAGHILRAWTQWCGGLVIATAVLALLLPQGLPSRKLGQAEIDQGDRISSTRQQARQLLGVYLGLTFVMGVAAVLTIPDWREALALVLAAISTAGFSPRADSLASYSMLGQGVIMLTCVLGAVSLLFFVLLTQGKAAAAWSLGTVQRLGIALAVATLVYLLFILAMPGGREVSLYAHGLNLVSGLTTAGFSTGPVAGFDPALLVLIFAMAWGGDHGSTAGGLKLARLSMGMRAVWHMIQNVRLPEKAVAPMRRHSRPVGPEAVISILSLITLYLSAAMLLWLHFLAHGHPALPALFDTVSALSTVGLSTGLVGADLAPDLKLSLAFAMLLGRLEFIAVLVLLAPGTWRRRS